jgi:hypothetical protein
VAVELFNQRKAPNGVLNQTFATPTVERLRSRPHRRRPAPPGLPAARALGHRDELRVTTLAGKREELRAALETAGFFAFSTVPEVVTPPLVFVTPERALRDARGRDLRRRHRAPPDRHRRQSPGVNEVTADELDQMVQGSGRDR